MKILFYTIIIQFYRLKINKNRNRIQKSVDNKSTQWYIYGVDDESTKTERRDCMTDEIELDYAIKKAGLDRAEVAKGLQISATALFNKIHNKTEFKASEIVALKKMLHLSDRQRDKIFFAAFVDRKSTKA